MSGRRMLMRAMWKKHRFWFRVSGGRIGRRVAGLPVLELTTTGRTSGRPRSVMLMYVDDPRGFVVIASNAGANHDPAWWRNLQAEPRGSVRVARGRVEVVARELDGDERDAAWNQAAERYRGYERHRQQTTRRIAVILLERRDDE